MNASTATIDQQARWYSLGRVGFGVAFLAAPGLLRNWIGPQAREPGTKVIARAFGVRDLALGVAGYLALEGDDAELARRLLQLSAACDAVDGAATLLAVRRIPARGALLTLAVATFGAATGLTLARRL